MVQLFFDRIIDGLGNSQKMGQPKGRANNNFSRSWNLCVLNDNKKIINRSASFWLDFAAPANAQLEVINKHLHHVEVGVEGNQHPWPVELWRGQGDNRPPPLPRISVLWNLDLRKTDLGKNLDSRKIFATPKIFLKSRFHRTLLIITVTL